MDTWRLKHPRAALKLLVDEEVPPRTKSKRTRIKEGRAKRNKKRFYDADGRARGSKKLNKPNRETL